MHAANGEVMREMAVSGTGGQAGNFWVHRWKNGTFVLH